MKRSRGELNDTDKISRLPDELIHHVLSFIDTKFAVRTCVLAKRWRYIWTSLPKLNFDHCLYDNYKNYCNVINKVLKYRNNDYYIQRFHFNFFAYSCDRAIRLGRIRAAFKANRMEDVSIYSVDERTPVKHLFTCESLKRLSLEGQYMKQFILPNSIYLPRLVFLKLHYFPYEGGEKLNKLISSCPILEDLDIMSDHGFMMNFKIRSPTLKHLKIRAAGRITLRLDAPNLVSLATSRVAVENVSKTERYRLKFLEVLHNVKYLTLSAATFKDNAGVLDFFGNQVSEFCNLRHLKLHHTDFSSSYSVFVIACFLKNTPNIESLTLELTSYPDSDLKQNEMKSCLELFSTTFTLNKLKIFEIFNFQGRGIEMKLVEILLRNANALEKLYLISEDGFTDTSHKRIVDEVAAFPRASPFVSLFGNLIRHRVGKRSVAICERKDFAKHFN